MWIYLKFILGIILAVVLHRGYLLYQSLDYGKKMYNHYPGPCHQVKGVDYGSENVYMFRSGITFITSGFATSQPLSPVYAEYYNENKIKGRILMFNFKNPEKVAKEMTLTSTKEFDRDRFQPHGISGWEDKKTGKQYLFVVNHEREGQERIEKFRVSMETQSLTHVKSYFGDPTFTLLNDVAATGEDSFYFTNMLSSSSKIGMISEALLRLSWSTAGYYGGGKYTTVAEGLGMANGIDTSVDGRYVYILESGTRVLRIYRRQDSNSLDLVQIYPFASAPDNVVCDLVSGDLYIALHPIGYLMMEHMDNPRKRAPSQVLQLKLKDGNVSSVTELFVDDGNLLTASTVAAVYNKKLLIGSFMDKLVYCDIVVPF